MKLPWETDEFEIKQQNKSLPWETEEYTPPNYTVGKEATIKSRIQEIKPTYTPNQFTNYDPIIAETTKNLSTTPTIKDKVGRGEAFTLGVGSGLLAGVGADEMRERYPDTKGWITAGEIAGSLVPFGAAYKLAKPLTKGIANPIARAVATGLIGDTPLGALKGGVEAANRGEDAKGIAKSALTEGALYGGAAAVLGPLAEVALPNIARKVFQRFKGKPVAKEVLEREVAKDIGVNWDSMNNTQKDKIRKVVADMQGEAVASGRQLNVGQEFTMRDVTPQDRLRQVLPEQPKLLSAGQDFTIDKPKPQLKPEPLALPQPKQNFTLEPKPLEFKTQKPRVDFERPQPQRVIQPKTETLGNTTFEINKKPGTPLEARDFENVGNRSVKAISYENPQLRPYYQYEAQNILGELKMAVPGERTSTVNQFGERIWTGTKKEASETIETIQNITGATYKEIEDALQAIIYDKGRENNALSKRIELIIDDNLSYGYTAFDGRPIPANQDYLRAKENLYIKPKLQKPLLLPAGQNFELQDPLRFRKQVARKQTPRINFDNTPIPGKPINQIDKTFQSQYNNETEIKRQLAKYYSNFKEGLDEATGAIADLQSTESRIRNRRNQNRGFNNLPGRQSGRIQDQRPYKTVGLSFSKDLIEKGKVNLTGHKFNSVDELATVAQVFRDPRFETFRMIYTKNNQIVGTDAITSRMPSVTIAFLDNPYAYMRKHTDRMKRLGADGYYLLHNHPSGQPKPSKDDIRLTQKFANAIKGFKGHVIINSNKYTELYPKVVNGRITLAGNEDVPLNLGKDLLLEPSVQHSLLGRRINGSNELARMAKNIQADKNISVVVYADAKLNIKGIQEVSNTMFNDKNFGGFLRNQAREHGGNSVFIVGDSSIEKQTSTLINNGFVLDAYIRDSDKILRDHVPYIKKGDWMGLYAKKEGRALTPPKPFKDTSYRISKFETPVLSKKEQLALPQDQEFQLVDPLRFKKQIPGPIEKGRGKAPDLTPPPLKFKKTIEVPRTKLQPDLTPPPIKTKVENNVIKPVIKATQKVDEGTLFNPKELKDISGFSGYATDVYRNFKKVFGKNYDKVKKTILDPFDKSKKQNAEFQKSWAERLDKEIVQGLGIKKGSKLSELVQKYGEGTLTEKEFNSLTPQDLEKIQKADQWFRDAYNELLDQVNTVRQRIYPNNPDKIIPKRQNYYRHFQEITNDIQGLRNVFATPAQIDPALEGISEFTKPKAAWKSWAQRRTGVGEFKNDAVGGFLNYLPSASYGIHIDPHISVFAKLAGDLSKATKDTKNVNNFIRFLNRYSQDLAGKTNPVDRIAQEVTGRKFFRALDWLNRRVKANVILANIGSTMSQLGNVPQGIAYAKQYSIPGFNRTIRSIFQPNEAIQKSGFVTERYLDKIYRKFDTNLLSKPRNLAVWMMETADKMGTHIIWNSAYEKALAEGAENAIKQADDITRELVAGRGIGEVPIGQKSRIIQTIMPFTLEVANLWKVQKDMLSKKDIVGLLMLYGSAYAFNDAMEKTRGTRIVFDPIDALVDAFSEEGLTPLERGGRLAGEVIGSVPMGQFVGSMYPEYGTTVGGIELPTRKQLFGRNDPTRYGTGLLVQKGLQDPLFKVAMPFGGTQLQKTLKGTDAIKNKGVYSDKDKTKLKYPVSTDTTSKIKGTLFGTGGFPETKEYYENNRRPLSENQTKEINSLKGETREKAYRDLMFQRRYDTLMEKLKKVDQNQELTAEQKKAQKLQLIRQIENLKKEYREG